MHHDRNDCHDYIAPGTDPADQESGTSPRTPTTLLHAEPNASSDIIIMTYNIDGLTPALLNETLTIIKHKQPHKLTFIDTQLHPGGMQSTRRIILAELPRSSVIFVCVPPPSPRRYNRQNQGR